MTLPTPRIGESMGFHAYRHSMDAGTLGDPEKIVWSSIKHLCTPDVADSILYGTYNIRNQRLRKQAATSINLYIQQAAELYDAAQGAKSNTAPLFYYYAFLNLAKARCEMHRPQFHRRPENYNHGLSWSPSPQYVVNVERELVSITTRGVWHVLWEALVGRRCPALNPYRWAFSGGL